MKTAQSLANVTQHQHKKLSKMWRKSIVSVTLSSSVHEASCAPTRQDS